MTIKQYSDIQRQLGCLEGLLTALNTDQSAIGYDSLEILSNTIDEVWEAEHGGID